jgi:hypothetical protein
MNNLLKLNGEVNVLIENGDISLTLFRQFFLLMII